MLRKEEKKQNSSMIACHLNMHDYVLSKPTIHTDATSVYADVDLRISNTQAKEGLPDGGVQRRLGPQRLLFVSGPLDGAAAPGRVRPQRPPGHVERHHISPAAQFVVDIDSTVVWELSSIDDVAAVDRVGGFDVEIVLISPVVCHLSEAGRADVLSLRAARDGWHRAGREQVPPPYLANAPWTRPEAPAIDHTDNIRHE
eukprot:scaffold418949_cov23-Prasinocladus_malaysianus.AAC.1